MLPPNPPSDPPRRRRRRLSRWLLPLAALTVAATPSAAHAIERGTIDVSVTGNGRVTGTQIDCPGTSCSGTFFWPDDTPAPLQRLTAVPGPGFALDRWDGCFAVVNRPLECDAMPNEYGSSVHTRFVDVEDPTLEWRLPADHSVFAPGGRFDTSVSAADNDAVTRVEYRLDGEVAGEGTSAPWGGSVLVPSTTADGIHQLTAQAFDRAGRRSDIRTRTVVVDGAAPTIAFAGPGVVETQASSYGVQFAVTDEHLALTACAVTGPSGTRTDLGACPPGTVTVEMPEVGTWKLTVSAVDRAGNRAEDTVTLVREAVPDPGPGPGPGPGPDPHPGPDPQPGPSPDPGPGPAPQPGPGPLPGPAPIPSPPGAPDTTGPGTPKAPTSSPKRCVVPQVRRGTTLKTAKQRLIRANCRVRTKRARSKTVRSGRVIRISSKAGRKLPKGTRITVTVARR
jgi:hypothetical protein